MSLSMCVLGSGSAGNCTLVALSQPGASRFILIDAGLSPRMTARRMAPLGVNLDRVKFILLTHLDSDHFHPGWLRAAPRLGITICLHVRHAGESVAARSIPGRVRAFNRSIRLGEQTLFTSLHLPHDVAGTTGLLIEHNGLRVGYATDLGRVPPRMLEMFSDLDALAIESNYDPDMQLASSRPLFLKRRIMGGTGHLSNEQSLDAVLRIAGQSRLEHVALLHLSRQCNDPRLIRQLYRKHARHLMDRLTITNQHDPTPMLHVGGGTGLHATLFDAATASGA